MSKKHFSWLLLLTLMAAGLVLLVPGKTGKESIIEETRILPELAAQVNDIEWVQIISAGDVSVATLRRAEEGWIVEEAGGYRADWDRIRQLLSALSQAEIIEAKTSNPEYYQRLSVEDVSSATAGGLKIEFSADSGLPALIVGKTANSRNGQYVRLDDSAASALLDRVVEVSGNRSDWLDKTVIDIADAEVVEVTINHPDGDAVTISKISADDENFDLQDIPEGREVRTEWTVNAPANALAALSFEDVVPDSRLDWSGPVRFKLLTADGLHIEVELTAITGEDEVEQSDEHWMRLTAGLYTTALNSGDGQAATAPETAERAEIINARVAGWAYRIPKYKFDSMVKRMEDLLQPPET
ncbi:MAG: DUF4340 domain-containing protein [Gammaproteobacteria bacterium]|jgi:hypothetical protein|nr:DUF4340 domain-containing protein [Gammaproteobacteria bacterium]